MRADECVCLCVCVRGHARHNFKLLKNVKKDNILQAIKPSNVSFA
jgi:hypothetical protein